MAAILKPWVGNPRLFSNRIALGLENSLPGFKYVNDGMYWRPWSHLGWIRLRVAQVTAASG